MIDRLENDETLRTVATIAEMDGVSIRKVARRGMDDLAVRMALILRRVNKQKEQ